MSSSNLETFHIEFIDGKEAKVNQKIVHFSFINQHCVVLGMSHKKRLDFSLQKIWDN